MNIHPFGTVGYFNHRGKDYPCVVVSHGDDYYFLYIKNNLLFPERNQPLTALFSEFRPDPNAAFGSPIDEWSDEDEAEHQRYRQMQVEGPPEE